MEKVISYLNSHDWKGASEAHREIDYWLSRCKTQRLIDELETEDV